MGILAKIAPRFALKRAQARMALDVFERGYEAAGTGRRLKGFSARSTSANAEVGPSITRSRDRARTLVRDDPYVRRAFKVWKSNTVGKGIVPQTEHIELFNEWSDECCVDGKHDFYGLESLISGTVWLSGECLVRFIPRKFKWRGMKVPFQLQVLEADHLDHSKTVSLKRGGYVIQGVEFNADLEVVAYWLFNQHPGDGFSMGAYGQKSERVPADDLIYISDPDRPGQVRSITELSAAIVKIRDLGDYEGAEVLRKKIEACFVAFVEQEEGSQGNPLTSNTKDESGLLSEHMAPGTIKYLKKGQSVNFGAPSSNDGGFADFMRDQKHGIAAGIGVTYQQMTGDLSQANYSSMRGGLMEFRGVVEQFQQFVLVHQLCKPVWKRFVQYAQLSGVMKSEPSRPKWTLPAVKAIDPFKDAMADLIQVRSGFITLEDVIAKHGGDLTSWKVAMKNINKICDEEGFILDSDPRKTAKAGGVQDIAKLILEEDTSNG